MGEDPYLASQMCVPYIQGLQSNGVACCVKHYALNEQETFRDHVDVRVSDRALYELYLRPFHAAVTEGGAWSIMGSYNQYLDQHATHNARLINDILKKEWGFNGPTIPAGAKRIVCMASSYIAMFDALGQVDKIVGVSGIDYVSNPYILAHKNSIKDMGPEMNYELLLGLKPDVVLLYGIGDAQTAVTDKLKELYIPYMYVGEYLEESPLGKAEWLVALAELTDSREKGIEIFREIPKRYQVLKALTETVEQRPTVMLNTPWNDSWVMPSTQSYMAQLVTDAGADYIYQENKSNSSTPIGLETAYKLIQKADYWINVGMASTLDELKTVNPKFVDAKAVREKTVYNNNLRTTPTGGNDYWESAVVRPDVVLRDLIHIFHPELVSDSLYYYRHLE
jgi:iron complex transport system substrate-binding protein